MQIRLNGTNLTLTLLWLQCRLQHLCLVQTYSQSTVVFRTKCTCTLNRVHVHFVSSQTCVRMCRVVICYLPGDSCVGSSCMFIPSGLRSFLSGVRKVYWIVAVPPVWGVLLVPCRPRPRAARGAQSHPTLHIGGHPHPHPRAARGIERVVPTIRGDG